MRFLLELRTRGGLLFQLIYGKQVKRKDFTCALSKSILMLMFASV